MGDLTAPSYQTGIMASTSSVPPRRRGGFTLIETIVTVGLIAVIAAFVVPTVIQKAGSGDPVKVQNDLNTVRTAIETFATDIKNGYPHQISTLTAKPTPGTDVFLDSTAMTATQIAVWNGPYMGATISSNVGDSLATGFTAYIMNFIDRYDAIHNVPEHKADGTLTGAPYSSTSTLYAAVQVHGLTATQAKTLNALFDGQSDVNLGDGSNTTGRFRFSAPNSSNIVVAYYLADPII
jgi:prepilin-type N-terminal cleavage/methylation domain-containing protein